MYSSRFRIRTLMIAVAVVALLCWAGLACRDWFWLDQPIDTFDYLEMMPPKSSPAEHSSKPTTGPGQGGSLEILPTR
jgi:hypothetical protein